MDTDRQSAILTIALFAAFADGHKDDAERERIREIAASLDGGAGDVINVTSLYQHVLLGRVTLEQAAARLQETGERQLAYEMAVVVCDADGRQSASEREFLGRLRGLLALGDSVTRAVDDETDAFVALGEEVTTVPAAGAAALASPDAARLDAMVLRNAMLAGALELLPQSWATLAILPLQMRLVYNVGREYGVSLDQGHIKEFLITAGIGMGSQTIEQFGRKVLGGWLGKLGGRKAAKVGSAATGIAFSFVTTYALGQLARRYYAGGRSMSAVALREGFEQLKGPAAELQARHLPDMRKLSTTLDAGKVMEMIRRG